MSTELLKEEAATKIRIMRWILIIGFILGLAKFFAWYATHSNAILTDALESLINIIAAAFGLFALIYTARPKDENHPYGHGKMEFFAVGFEGGLIFFTGVAMLYKAANAFFNPVVIEQLNFGISITLATGAINFLMGYYLQKKGNELNSVTLKADGQHLMTDTYSSGVLLVGLVIIHFSHQFWMDSALTVILAIYIIVIGFKLLKNALSGLMDETDYKVVSEIIEALNTERKETWIDIHNLRVVKYGSSLHIDAHLTLPWYHDLNTTHDTVKQLEELINTRFKNRVEFFIHTDPCNRSSCPVCMIKDCKVRQQPFQHKIEWTSENLLRNLPHTL